MLRAAALLAFLASAHAQPPRSPILLAISPSLTASAATLPEMIKALDGDGKTRALAGLDRLDRGPLDAAALAELSEAYRLLGRPAEALKAARELSSNHANGSAGVEQSILSLAQAGDYPAAQAAAESGLKRFPGNKDLLALFHQVKGRASGKTSPEAPLAALPAAASSPETAADARPFVLRVPALKGAPPPSPAASTAYLAPGSVKASDDEVFWSAFRSVAKYKIDYEWPAEIKRMTALRAKLDETETGRALVAELGGWDKIQRDVDIRFAGVGNPDLNAYFRSFKTPNSKGQRGSLVLNKALVDEPDAVAVPILAHELSHVRDFRGEPGLAIPSEFAAHRTQVQVFEEMKAKMTPAEIIQLRGNPRARYQNFIALLWEDHLLQRFKTAKEMAAAAGSVGYESRAAAVLLDLRDGSVAPGGAQLDHHLNGVNEGLYRNLTGEKDIVDIIHQRESSGNYDSEQRRRDKEILVKRAALVGQSDKRDGEFRSKHGFQIGATK